MISNATAASSKRAGFRRDRIPVRRPFQNAAVFFHPLIIARLSAYVKPGLTQNGTFLWVTDDYEAKKMKRMPTNNTAEDEKVG